MGARPGSPRLPLGFARGSDLDLLVVLLHVEDKRRATLEIMRALNGLPVKDIVLTTPAEIAARGNAVGYVLRPACVKKVLYERD